MRKNNKIISIQRIKRANKNLARKKRRAEEIDAHVEWLDILTKAGKELDMDKLMYKVVNEEKILRNTKTTKLIIDRLVSRNVRKK